MNVMAQLGLLFVMLTAGWLAILVCIALLKQGRHRAVLGVVVGFLGFVTLGTAHAAAPPGITLLGVRGATVTCTPGAGLLFGSHIEQYLSEGTCPTGGSFSCGYNSIWSYNGQAPGWYSDGSCFEITGSGGDPPPVDPGTPTAVSLKPFDISTEDGIEISAAIIGVWAVAWACRALVTVLRDREDGD